MANGSGSPYDVVVVGAGNAALTAALSAAQQGAKVLLLEKAPEVERGGNSRFSGGLFRFAYDGIADLRRVRADMAEADWKRIEAPPYDGGLFTDDVMRVTQGQADQGLTKTLVEQSLPTILWLTELGMQWQWSVLWRVEEEGRLRFSPGAILEAKEKGIGLVDQLFSFVGKASIRVAYGAKMTGFFRTPLAGSPAFGSGWMRGPKTSAPMPSFWGPAASRPTRRCAPATWGRVGTA